MTALQRDLHMRRLRAFAYVARYSGATREDIAAAVRAGIVAADRERLGVTVIEGGRR